jgi:hypothetical protein
VCREKATDSTAARRSFFMRGFCFVFWRVGRRRATLGVNVRKFPWR